MLYRWDYYTHTEDKMQYWIHRKFIFHRLSPIIWRNEQITTIPSPNFIQFNSLHFPCFWHKILIRMKDYTHLS